MNNLKVEDYVKVGDYVDYNPTIASKDGTKVEESKLSYTSPIELRQSTEMERLNKPLKQRRTQNGGF